MQFDKLEDIIDFAISKEQEAMDFYADLSIKVDRSDVAQELQKMAKMEQRHRDWLKENSVSLMAGEPAPAVATLGIAEYTSDVAPAEVMTWHDIVNIAMHREATAMNLYTSLSNLVSDSSAKQMFLSLAAEEARHKLYFETIWDDEVLIDN